MDFIKKTIDYIGFWNVFSILTFIFGTIYTVYTSYKSFFRLVYTYQKTCQECAYSKQWRCESQNFVSRIIFFNNGRKTLTKAEVTKIQIVSSEIASVKIQSEDSRISTRISRDRKALDIKFNYLDASRFFIVQLSHKGNIEVKGRVAESGTFLHTETRDG
jgi:hypothetical protein